MGLDKNNNHQLLSFFQNMHLYTYCVQIILMGKTSLYQVSYQKKKKNISKYLCCTYIKINIPLIGAITIWSILL